MKKLEIKYIEIGKIKPYKKNPRKNDKAVDVVEKSIKEFGFKNPIILDKNNEIIAGHTRLKAAIKLKMKEVPVIRAEDLTDKQVKAFRIMDNKSSEYAEWDMDILKEELHELEDTDYFDSTGFSTEEISELWDDEKEIEEDTISVDAYERAKSKTKIKPGDIYQLGNHRLMCGDSTESQTVSRLMNGVRIDLLFTDPPYGISIVPKSGKIGGDVLAKNTKYHKIIGDDKYFDVSFLLKMGKSQIIWGANYFHDKLPLGTRWIVWDKDRPEGTTFSDCELAWTNIVGVAINKYKCTWNGMIREGESGKRVHPTQKPLKLCSDILNDYAKESESVLDLFGGSGSTLIACEQMNRKCYMMELDPVYCQVIIDRWEKFTGNKAEKL